VYARVSGSIDWIEQSICELSDTPPDWCSDAPHQPTPQPKSGPTATTISGPLDISFRVDVQYDKFPKEFSWYIKDVASGKKLAGYPRKSVKKGHKFLQVPVNLTLGGDYVLGMRDKFGDGICCNPITGEGFIDIIALVNGEEVYINGVWGDMEGKKTKIKFSVPVSLREYNGRTRKKLHSRRVNNRR
jgi:hypothetical protein